VEIPELSLMVFPKSPKPFSKIYPKEEELLPEPMEVI
jgi:hypothetical protein